MIVMNGAVGPITAKKNSSSEPRTEAEAGHGYSQSVTVYWLVVVEGQELGRVWRGDLLRAAVV